jgi:hypothetical protein
VYLVIVEVVVKVMEYAKKLFKSTARKSDTAAQYKYIRRVVYWNILAILVTLLIGALGLMVTEGWSFATALYFAVETSTVRFSFFSTFIYLQ